jgi:hypothetical protein
VRHVTPGVSGRLLNFVGDSVNESSAFCQAGDARNPYFVTVPAKTGSLRPIKVP